MGHVSVACHVEMRHVCVACHLAMGHVSVACPAVLDAYIFRVYQLKH